MATTKRASRPARKAPAAAIPAPAPLKAAVAPAAPPAPLVLPRLGGLWAVLAVLAAFFVPASGLTLGLLYASQEDRKARNLGRWLLVLAFFGWFFAFVSGVVKNAMGAGEWFVQPYY